MNAVFVSVVLVSFGNNVKYLGFNWGQVAQSV